jgi:hypothetical protein
MHHGEIAGEGSPEEIFSSPELVKKTFKTATGCRLLI